MKLNTVKELKNYLAQFNDDMILISCTNEEGRFKTGIHITELGVANDYPFYSFWRKALMTEETYTKALQVE